MSASCRKPGCGRHGVVSITYDPVACQVWIDPLPSVPGGGQMLCDEHAQRLSPPRGWVVIDRRDPQSSIVAAEPVALVDQMRSRPRIARRWGQFDEPRLEFTSDATARAVPVRPGAHITPPPPVVEAPPFERPAPVVHARAGNSHPEAVPVEPPPAPEPEPALEPEPEPALAAVHEAAGQPEAADITVVGEVDAIADDLSDLLKPTGRLLSRAFKSGGDQKSVLTVTAPNDDAQ